MKNLKQKIEDFIKKTQRLSKEDQGIIIAYTITAIACFFPWIEIEPYDFSIPRYWISAFSGHTLLMGWTVFLMAIAGIYYFINQLEGKKKITLPTKEEWIFLGASAQSVLLLIFIISIWNFSKQDIGNIEIRFGIFVCLFAQATAGMFAFLKTQNEKMNTVKNFFHQEDHHKEPTEKKFKNTVQTNLLTKEHDER